MRARGAVVVVALCLAPALAPGAWAGEPADQLFASMDQVLKIVVDPAFKQPQERRQAFHRTAGDMFDFVEIARRSLGRHWEARTPAEREEFVEALRELLERLYISKVELYNGEKITLLGDKINGDLATVKTKVVAKNGSEIPVDYRMILRGERWRACDVLIAGVSLVDNYRALHPYDPTGHDPRVEARRVDLIRRGQEHHIDVGGSEKGQIAFEAIVRGMADLALEPGPLVWRTNLGLRGLKALPVTFKAATPASSA